MAKWVDVSYGMPDTEIECVVAVKTHGLTYTHRTFTQWDGTRWVDAQGEEVKGVIAWTKAPIFNNSKQEVFKKLMACLENDKCENKDCSYFVTMDLLQKVLNEWEENT